MKKGKKIKCIALLLTIGLVTQGNTYQIKKESTLSHVNKNEVYEIRQTSLSNNINTSVITKLNNKKMEKLVILPTPKLENKIISIERGRQINEVTIDISNYDKKVSGWELYVTEEKNTGNEMFIDGIGYFFHSDNIGCQKATVLTDFNKNYTYKARAYVVLKGKKYYSDWSESLSISPILKTPELSKEFMTVENGHPTYDMSIDYQSYRINDKNYLSGWELYVTKEGNIGNEVFVDGVGYFLHSDNKNDAIRNVMTNFNENYIYRARAYIDTEEGRIYSDFSEAVTITSKLKAPILNSTYLETENELSKYDVFIDYPSYRIDDNNYLTGWELYVTTEENPGDEMIIDGVGYFLHSDNGNETIREILVDSTRVYKYRARVYVETEEGRIYSDFSDVMFVTGK